MRIKVGVYAVSRKFRLDNIFSVFLILGCAEGQVAEQVLSNTYSNLARFELSPDSIWDVPFPSDIFTVPDQDMVTGLRVSLPMPDDVKSESERKDIQAVNQLDGFSLFPRITIPFSGDTPDPATFTSSNIFLVALSPPQRGAVIAIDQRVIDDGSASERPRFGRLWRWWRRWRTSASSANDGKLRLICAPEVYLRESSRYALVVTKGLTADNKPIRRTPALTQVLGRYESGARNESRAPPGGYRAELFDALDVLTKENKQIQLEEVLTLSVFTTRTVTDVAVKLRDRLESGEFPITAPNLNVDGKPGREVFDAEDILSMDIYFHRASQISDGSNNVRYPPRALSGTAGINADWQSGVYVTNVRTGKRIRLPASAAKAYDQPVIADVSALAPRRGDELALLAIWNGFNTSDPPYLWSDYVGKIAFGSFEAPQYTDATALIPVSKTGPGFLPEQTGTDTVSFVLVVPKGEKPSRGWPVAHYIHGGSPGWGLEPTTIRGGAVLAQRGVATLAFSAPDHGGGPLTTIEVTTKTGSTVVIPGSGRSIDVNGDMLYEPDKTYRTHHPLKQRIADYCACVRSVQLGTDIDGDGTPDLSRAAKDTYAFGISFGGRTVMAVGAIEPRISVIVPNVPGDRISYGYFPRQTWRAMMDYMMMTRIPKLTNGPSPLWGGRYNEDIPVKGLPVQVGLVAGAEPIQRALDFMLWINQAHATAAYAHHVSSGDLRDGKPPKYLCQIARGDGFAGNPLQYLIIKSGGFEKHSSITRLDNEPAFDRQYAFVKNPTFIRHISGVIQYRGGETPENDIGGYICHLIRVQIADFLASRGTKVSDPDGDAELFAGDVFQTPIPKDVLEEIKTDRGF